jgi:hypothetical protein
MSYNPDQGNIPEDPSTPPNAGGYAYPPTTDPAYQLPANPYPPTEDPGYPLPVNPYPPVGGPGYPPPGNPYPPVSGPGYPPPPPMGGPGYPPTYANQPYPGYNPPLQFTPKPLKETLQQLPRQYWRVISHPGATTFAEEQMTASWGAIWVQVIVYGIVVAILAALFSRSNVPILFVNAFAGPFIVAGIFWLIAKAFRGQGRFLQYMYCSLLFSVPLGIVSNLLMPIPVVGMLVGFIVGIYGIVLLIFMTMGVHRMSGGKATLAVLILPIGLILLSCIISAIAFPLILHAVQSAQNMQTY